MGDIYTGADKLEAYLEHHGILGMKWGVRRYQPYADAKKRANSKEIGEAARKAAKREAKAAKKEYKQKYKEKVKDLREDLTYNKIAHPKEWKAERKELYSRIRSDAESRKAYNKAIASPLLGNIGRLIKASRISNQELRQIADGKDLADKLNILNARSPIKSLAEAISDGTVRMGPKATEEEAAEFWKALAKELEKEAR